MIVFFPRQTLVHEAGATDKYYSSAFDVGDHVALSVHGTLWGAYGKYDQNETFVRVHVESSADGESWVEVGATLNLTFTYDDWAAQYYPIHEQVRVWIELVDCEAPDNGEYAVTLRVLGRLVRD
jgi:hypothetical protein